MTIFNAKAEIDKLRSLDFTQTQAAVIQANKEVGSYLLTLNFANNRKVNSGRVASYRQAMIDGEWVTGDPLKFSVDGIMIDGQHRADALSKLPEEVTVPIVILTGQPIKASETYDQGMNRNAVHISKLRGFEYLAHSHISTLRVMFTFRMEGSNAIGLSPARIIDVFEKYPKLKEAIDFSFRYHSKLFGFRYGPVCAAIARAKISDYPLSDQDLDFFCHVLQGGLKSNYDGETQRSEVAPLLLRNIYLAMKRGEDGGKKRNTMFYKTQSALQAFAQNKDIKNIKGTTVNLFPVPFIDSMNFKTLEFDPSINK